MFKQARVLPEYARQSPTMFLWKFSKYSFRSDVLLSLVH